MAPCGAIPIRYFAVLLFLWLDQVGDLTRVFDDLLFQDTVFKLLKIFRKITTKRAAFKGQTICYAIRLAKECNHCWYILDMVQSFASKRWLMSRLNNPSFNLTSIASKWSSLDRWKHTFSCRFVTDE